MKYIIKNCPALSYGRIKFKKCYRVGWKQDCKDITDCLLKQIVEKCKKRLDFLSYGISEQPLTMVAITELFAKAEVAQDILNLLEIEEVNENS